ncbi:MAG: cadherin-like domain-containing protein [Gemmataceae bacterium]
MRLAALTPLQVRRGGTEALTADHLHVDGAESAFLVDLVLVDPPACGTLLRDGFALNAGDVFTQEDVDHGRLCYRHDGATGADRFTFMTAEGDVPATAFPIEVTHAVRAPDLLGPGSVGDLRDGCRVRDLLAGVVRLDNPDEEPGLAVVAAAGGGAWEVSDDGHAWRELVDVRHSAAALLGPDERVRFVPRPGWSGTARLTYRAWDRRDGEPGRRVNLAPRHASGGSTAFSRQVETVVVTVAPPAERQARQEVLPWHAEPTVHDLFGGPVAVVRLDGEGVWQYSPDGGQWTDFGAVYHGRARLLGGGDRVRFLPRPGGGGRVVLAARPWSADEAAAGATVDLAAHRATGAGTAFGEAVHTRTWRLTG